MSDPTALFESLELFEALTRSEVREIVETTDAMRLEQGDVLFEQGDDSEAMFVIESGRLEVRSTSSIGDEVVLAELEEGAVVGEMSILAATSTRSATVEALGPTRLFRLSRRDFETLRDRDHPAAYKLVLQLARTLGERRRETDERIREVFDDPDRHLDTFEEQVHDMLAHLHKA
jgi:CRP-like cAMP-binding protein